MLFRPQRCPPKSPGLRNSTLTSRPQNLDEIIFQEEIVQSFKGIKNTGKLPHLLLYGPPGTGKTSIIHALAKEIFGPQDYKERILELNASDDRGIQKVREKIKKYAETKLIKLSKSVPNFKIIILDEADQMTADAQNALRRVMEDYSNITRFCLICNYVTKIIEPLNSRCVKFRFKQIPLDHQISQLKRICAQENLEIEVPAIEKLIEISEGDLRKSVNLLQLAKFSFASKQLSYNDIMKISDVL